MGKDSKIEWTNHTYNPWYGCQKVSTGCKHCYAERDMTRYGLNFRTITHSKTVGDPLRWTQPAFVFTCSWSDFFIPDADAWREEVWTIIRKTPHLVYQILTKRPENIRSRLPRDWDNGWNHVWLGVSVETASRARARIPPLLDIPARIRFVSAEPLLGPIDFTPYFQGLHWVIVGGESGPHQMDPQLARPLDMAWVRAIRNQCVKAGVPFFFKQDAHFAPGQRPYVVETDGSSSTWEERPEYTGTLPPTQPSLL